MVLQYALGSCPVLPRRDGFAVIRFADDGRACTSETKAETTLQDRAYYVAPNGDHTRDAGRAADNIIFAVAPDPFVIEAIDQCRWEDAKCWEGLRSR